MTKPGTLLRKIRFKVKSLESWWWGQQAKNRKANYNAKVFCIGFYKTGTSSFGVAMQELGYAHSSFYKKVSVDYYNDNDFDKILDYTARFDSFDDIPWFKEDMIPLLDEKFPGSKFVYLEREEAEWKRSFRNWSIKLSGAEPDLDKWLKSYRAHAAFIDQYFKNAGTNKFIRLSIDDPQGFEKLAVFLGKTAPRAYFPHENKT